MADRLFHKFAAVNKYKSLRRIVCRRLDSVNKLREDDLRAGSEQLRSDRCFAYCFATAGSERYTKPLVALLKIGENGLYAFLLVLAETYGWCGCSFKSIRGICC